MKNGDLTNNSNTVTICGHGHAHVQIGNTTLHMRVDDLTHLVRASLDALEKHQLKFSENHPVFQPPITH